MRRLKSHLSLLAFLLCAGTLHAAPLCPVVPAAPRANDQLQAWYETFVKPLHRPTSVIDLPINDLQVQALVEKLAAFNVRAARDPLFFEPLVQQIVQHFARAPNYAGLDRALASKIYRQGSGPDIDFSLVCIDTRAVRAPDDTFALTLFGVRERDCRHVGLRGLVFSESLVNGAANGDCRPEHMYYKNLIVSIPAGTNTVTFTCRKDENACLRQ